MVINGNSDGIRNYAHDWLYQLWVSWCSDFCIFDCLSKGTGLIPVETALKLTIISHTNYG